jgi:hypothetical protein
VSSIYLVALLASSAAADCELEEKIKQLICVLTDGPSRHFISTTESSFLPFLDCPSKTTFDSLKSTVERKMKNIERDNLLLIVYRNTCITNIMADMALSF